MNTERNTNQPLLDKKNNGCLRPNICTEYLASYKKAYEFYSAFHRTLSDNQSTGARPTSQPLLDVIIMTYNTYERTSFLL
jgi:hypothetical protein